MLKYLYVVSRKSLSKLTKNLEQFLKKTVERKYIQHATCENFKNLLLKEHILNPK